MTSTDAEDEETPKKRSKKEKKEKKRKKEKKKKKHRRRSESDVDHDEDDEKALRRKELDSHISMAKRISARERRSRSREGVSGGRADQGPYKRKICRVIREDIEERWV